MTTRFNSRLAAALLLAPLIAFLPVAALGCASDDAAAVGSLPPSRDVEQEQSIQRLQRKAHRFNAVIEVPRYERTPGAIEGSVSGALARADARLDALASQDLSRVTFESTVAGLDDITYPVVTTVNRMFLIRETNPDAQMREAARDQVQRIENWFTELTYREDVYRACKAFADAYDEGRRPRLYGEEHKLFRETMRDYRRAGMHLDAATRAQVESLQKEKTRLSTQFDANVTNARVEVLYTPEELAGVPEGLIGTLEQRDGSYVALATVTPHFVGIMANANSEESRRRMKVARYSVAMEQNGPILDDLVRVRDEIATLLGYASWADYQTEPKMAETGARASAFVDDLVAGLQSKFEAEIAEFQKMKANDTGDRGAQVRIWDWRYYENQLKKQKYDIDAEQLRAYFPLERCLGGMFDVYETIFGLRFEPVEAPYVWHEGVTLWAALDSASDEPMGLFYLDMHPREGKYNHFAQFGIVDGKLREDDRYQRPVVALVCNFTAPTDEAPSLISHDELETLFHEFGHALHSILTRAEFHRYSGTNVPRDFVEAPSQMLEAWVWSPEVLNTFAAHWQDPSQKINPGVLARMEEAKLATVATFYRRQLCFASADLRLHERGSAKDTEAIVNEAMAEVFLAPPEGTNFAAYWGHLTGYDAGYYGYAWADSIAADMESVFERAPYGLMDTEAGMRLRNEIYAVGGSREVEKSIRAFLGRDRSLGPFLEKLGIDRATATTTPAGGGAR